MWGSLEKISEQVTKYSTFLGQLWYILVFVFRLIVVVTIGNSAYNDEQSAFTCATDTGRCTHMCYNEFAKISHMRFWAFQLLAVATPTVFFHFYSMYISGEIEKIKSSENQLKQLEEGDTGRLSLTRNTMSEKDLLKMSRKMKNVGQIKIKQVYSGNELKEVPYTRKIQMAYYISIFFRLGFEGLFLYFGYIIFSKSLNNQPKGFLSFLWMDVPGVYNCKATSPEVIHACASHFHSKETRFSNVVPCFISRPFEKTVFLRYMTILSAICFVISALELLVLSTRKIWKVKNAKRQHKQYDIFKSKIHLNEAEYCNLPPSAPTRSFSEGIQLYPSLAVPVRVANSEISQNRKRNEMHSNR